MTVRSSARRLAAVTVGATIGLLGLALPASADGGGSGSAGPTATLSGRDVEGLEVNLVGGGTPKAWLLGLTGPDNEALSTYCIELETLLDRDQKTMQEVGWDEYPNDDNSFDANRASVNWVLQHSYPAVSVQQLVQDNDALDGLTKAEAITATQAAIWHYSDNATLDTSDSLSDGGDAADNRVSTLYEYLTGPDNTGADNEPKPSLSLDPATLSGEAGNILGPITVSTTADGASVTLKGDLPEGFTLTDAEGNPLDTNAIADGSTVYVDVPDDADAGSATLSASVTAPVKAGRLFIGMHYKKHPTQSLIVATSTPVERTDTATVNWTVATTGTTTPTTTETVPPTTTETVPPTTPTMSPSSGVVVPSGPSSAPPTTPAVQNTAHQGGLAYTGVAIGLPVGIGVLLLAGGGLLLLLQRRRRRT